MGLGGVGRGGLGGEMDVVGGGGKGADAQNLIIKISKCTQQ